MTRPIADAAAAAALGRAGEALLAAAATPFAGARMLARRLGASLDRGRATLGFWAPELVALGIPDRHVVLDVFEPPEGLDPGSPPARAVFRRHRFPLQRAGACYWAVVDGLRGGRRDRLGTLYALRFRDERGAWHARQDVLAASLPFGAFAPAELYDLDRMHADRADAPYYRALWAGAPEGGDGAVRIPPPANILQLHVGTATESGTLAGLTRRLGVLAERVGAGARLAPEDQLWLGFDAVQPLPLEPVIEYEAGPRFWVPAAHQRAGGGAEVEVALAHPDMTDWGYDVVLAASSAVNPALLESGRPDELVDLAVALHNFPGGPMRLVLDVVFGHTDDQALGLLDRAFFRGPNMYGQDVNQQHPVVRALMLEMQRRKVDFGADAVRVDGAQDLKLFDGAAGTVEHDDDYIELMGSLVQRVAGVSYRPWMVFEDGRPWPRADWPTASTYLAVIARQPHAFQWGPLTFAHNTPALEGFWRERWWRVEQIAAHGAHWISGCANHDTVRRGTQVDPDRPVNRRLGGSLKAVLERAYDHPAATLLWYAALPGVPMDFLQALARAPWGFVRNTDERYGVKILAEEAGFFTWQVEPAAYRADGAFMRLKALGFTTLGAWRRFLGELTAQIAAAPDDLVTVARRLGDLGAAPAADPAWLRHTARAAMDDMHAFCGVPRWSGRLDPKLTAFALRARRLRHHRPWLRSDLAEGEGIGLLPPEVVQGADVVWASRRAPGGGESLLLLANLAGDAVELTPASTPVDAGARWGALLASPGAERVGAGTRWRLPDGEAVVLRAAAATAGRGPDRERLGPAGHSPQLG